MLKCEDRPGSYTTRVLHPKTPLIGLPIAVMDLFKMLRIAIWTNPISLVLIIHILHPVNNHIQFLFRRIRTIIGILKQ
jgi:hypothetical protein